MRSAGSWITHNWHLKIVSLILAAMLWMAVANQTSSEVGLEVPLEYRNIPAQLEIVGDTTNTVQVRLRGASNLIKDITAKDVSTTIDLGKMGRGERVVPLSPQNVQAPFGAEVIRVNPSSVRFSLERTVTKTISVEAAMTGQLPDAYEVGKVSLEPATVEIEGPESRVNPLSSIATVGIRLDRKQSDIEQTVDLNVPDPQIRLPHPTPVNVHIEIRKKR
jgi:YbbR domain-containing protein